MHNILKESVNLKNNFRLYKNILTEQVHSQIHTYGIYNIFKTLEDEIKE